METSPQYRPRTPECRGELAPAAHDKVNGAAPDILTTIHKVFERRVAETPGATAIVFGDQQLTYCELNARANRLARYIVSKGVVAESLVGVCLRRSLDTVVALLAVLKAGGAYVPLDPDYPAERLSFMLRDTQASLLLSNTECDQGLPPCSATRVLIDTEDSQISGNSGANLDIPISPRNLVYVMYTSGSTGQPKGVMIEHRSVIRLVKDNDYASFGRDHRFLLLAPISFDASTFEIWGALLNGATLVVADSGMTSLQGLGEIIRRHRVDTVWLTAGLFNVMIEQQPEALAPLKQLLTGGDTGSIVHFRQALQRLPGCRLINGYGPTETTTFAVCMTVEQADLAGSSVPIGFPIAKTPVWLLDDNLNPITAGQTGEICIGGSGVARGYLNQPELTAEKFVTPAWATDPDVRLYRTGDRARRRGDGALMFLGRVDDQVKISGFRVEPTEVACVLREHPAVRDAVVIAEGGAGGPKRLVAYLVLRTGSVTDPSGLREFLGRRVPQFMVPSEFLFLETIPLTANGKVDRGCLRQMPVPGETVKDMSSTVTNSVETQVAAIWSQVLGVAKVGVQDNFFELGGDSLKLIAVHSKLQKQFGMKVPITALFESPTIAALAEHLSGVRHVTTDDFESRARRQRELIASRSRPSR
jgi:amino acid adenylation domain-containing protein